MRCGPLRGTAPLRSPSGRNRRVYDLAPPPRTRRPSKAPKSPTNAGQGPPPIRAAGPTRRRRGPWSTDPSRGKPCQLGQPGAAQPPDPGLEGFLTAAAKLGERGRISKLGIPKGVDGWLHGALMLDAYGGMVEMSFPPAPPKLVQRLVIPRLAALARRRGYSVGELG